MTLDALLLQIRACVHCASGLPLGPRPILRAAQTSRILIIGQAPGTKVHESGIPWDDASGQRLRHWMGVTPDVFYDEKNIAIVPMGFCYPGKGISGDMPPRPECASLWHEKLLRELPQVQLTLLIGQYAHARYLGATAQPTLTETVRHWEDYMKRGFFPLVHPSPRNQIWLKKNPWFEQEVVPQLQQRVKNILNKPNKKAEKR